MIICEVRGQRRLCCCSVAKSRPTLWTAACQTPLPFTVSPSLLNFICTESVMLSINNYLKDVEQITIKDFVTVLMQPPSRGKLHSFFPSLHAYLGA